MGEDWEVLAIKLPSFQFGDGPEMADRLGQLVVDGKKTATSSLVRLYEIDCEELPKVGERSIIENSKAEPLCAIEITQLVIKPFSEVEADFARAEGEGDLSLEYWQREHRKFFTKFLPEFEETMLVVCETFRVLHIY